MIAIFHIYAADELTCHITPPENSTPESYNMFWGVRHSGSYDSGFFDRYHNSVYQKIIFGQDSIYIQGLMRYGQPYKWWIKGAIKGNKAIFSHREPIGRVIDNRRESKNSDIYLFTCEDGGKIPAHSADSCYNLKEDLILDYDADRHTLSNPNHWFCFRPVCVGNNPDTEWESWPYNMTEPGMDFNYGQCYFDRILITPSSDEPDTPLAPQFSLINLNGIDYFELLGNHVTENGLSTYPGNLTYVVYVKENINRRFYPSSSREYLMEGKGNEICKAKYEGYIPYSVIWPEQEEKPRPRKIYYKVQSKPFIESYAIIEGKFYSEYGELKGAYESDRAYLDNSGIEAIGDENEADGAVYDLTGRRVSRDNLAPGIYISNGQKFIVK